MRFYETMIESLRGMAVFVAVAEAGSFVGAARRLGLTTSVVSHHIKKFEDYNNVALFYRSTRALSLTADGQRLLEPALRMIAAAEQGLDALADVGAEPAGAITLSLPGFLSAGGIEQAIWGFAARYT